MNWEDYYRRYKSFALAMRQADLVAIVATKALCAFPASLPGDWKNSVMHGFAGFVGSLRGALAEMEMPASGEAGQLITMSPNETDEQHEDSHDPHAELAEASVLLMIDGFRGTEQETHDFAEAASSQLLAIGFAHISAFISDTLRVICRHRPEVLRSDRTLTCKSLLDIGNWDGILSQMIEDYVFKFGWSSVPEIVSAMRQRLGLQIAIPQWRLDNIGQAELLRNLIIHNGTRVSSEYLKRTGRTDVGIGDKLLVDSLAVRRICFDLLVLAGEIFLDVSEVHFGKTRTEITGVWLHDNRPHSAE
jgi:hypothetical protein